MRKLKLFFACLLMTLLSIGQVWADDEVVYTLTPVTGSDNGYASAEDIDITDGETTITWNVTGNATLNPWGIGGKKITNVVRPIYSKDALSDDVTKVVVTYGSSFTLSTATAVLKVYSTAASAASGGSTNLISTVNGDNGGDPSSNAIAANAVHTFNKPNGDDWSDAYYRFEFTCTYTSNNNKKFEFAKAEFYAEAAAPAYTITAQSNDESKGTVSLTGSVITGSPKANCRYASPAYTVTSGNATVAQSGNAFTVTPSSDCTVRINFEAIPQYTVTWNNNGSTSTTQVVEGAKPTFPAKPASCATDCDKFYGWATEAWTGKLTDISGKTIHTSNATMDAVTAEGTVYYAVFTDVVATDYSTTYTSNVTLPSSGANVSSATLVIGENDDIDAFKLGKSGAGATSSFTVPSGTTKIYLHAAAWNGKTVSLTLATDVGSISPDDAQDLTSNSGIANSSPFTLNTTGTGFDFDDLFFEYTLENVDDEAEITVTATGERAVIWGVNAVASASSGDAHYMTTCAACTHLDDAPELDGTIAVTHNTATINWKTLTNASSYDVTVIRNSDSESIFSGNVNALTKALTGLDPETQYDYSIMGVGDGSTYCTTGNGVLNGSFTTDAAPTAKLYLVQLKDEEAVEEGTHTVGVEFDLPTSAATCGKTLVGWTTEAYKNYTHTTTAPAVLLKKYTFTSTDDVTLYAVYATVASSTAEFNAGNYATANSWEDATAYSGFTINGVTFTANGGGNNGKYYVSDKTWRLYNGGSISLSATGNILSVSSTPNLSFTIDGTSATFSFTATTKISSISVTYEGVYSNYSTTCEAPLAAPTFSVDPAGGPFDTEISVELDAAEGTIYYTLNGTDPTNESTEYTDPIVLNTCGNKTIKAIAISSTNHSAVASATYEMNIPVPTNSQVAPYSPTEARDVIASGCYDGSTIMYVKGVVKSASAWNETYGNYDVVVRNIGNEDSETFTYYHMYAASGKDKFTSDENIEVGDTILAAGVLTLYGSTYEFANNTCYMVWHHKMVTPKTPIANDEATAYTVEQAKVFCNAPMTYELSDEVYVKGVAYGAPNNQGTFNIHDANSDNTFQIYKGALSAALEALGVEIEENDTIVAKGTIQYYNSTTYQMNAGGEVVTVKKYVAPVVAVTGVEVDATATVKAGKTVQLTATVLPDNASNKNVTWTVESGDAYAEVSATGLVTGKAEGTAVIRATSVADDTKYGECTVTVNPGTPANTDIITAEAIGLTSSGYNDWSNKSNFGTASVYAGNSMNATGANAGALQLRYNATDVSKRGGIVLTTSNGLVLKKLSVTVKSGSGTLNVYAKNTAYSGYADVLSSEEATCGKLIGTVSATGEMTLVDGVSYDDNYQYIGMRPASGTLYLTDITITWGNAVTPTPIYETVRNELTPGNYYTICYPKAMTDVQGATLWSFVGKDANFAYLVQETATTIEAGKPYIMYATASTVTAVLGTDVASAGVNGAIHGTLDPMDQTALNTAATDAGKDLYLVIGNELRRATGTSTGSNTLPAQRAFVVLGDIPAAPAHMPAHVRAMPMHKDAATGLDALNASDKPVKMVINGQLFILRGEKMYDATGKLVK